MPTNLLYSDYSDWYHLLDSPAEHEEEVQIYTSAVQAYIHPTPVTLLELGSGGGGSAYFLKRSFQTTLVDLSPEMLALSQQLNPECEWFLGDMRSVRLGRTFDAVFINDAISYMNTRDQLRQAIKTAYAHCRSGGAALFVPDFTVENYKDYTDHGGFDRAERGLRYLEWTLDFDPDDEMYSLFMVYLLKDGTHIRQSTLDEHRMGLFSEQVWLDLIAQAGFTPHKLPFDHSTFEPGKHFMFLGEKR